MHPTLRLACSAFLALLLACASPAPEARPFAPHERIGTANFSIEMPPGEGWKVRKTDFSLTLERRTRSWLHVAETVLVCVSRHSLPPQRRDLPERELAAQFLEAEKGLLSESEAEEDVSTMTQREWTRQGRKLYQLAYEMHSRCRSDDATWGDEVLLRKGEIYVYFPDGSRGPHFFCFEIRVTRRPGYPERLETLRWIDGVIDGFRREEPDGRPDLMNVQPL